MHIKNATIYGSQMRRYLFLSILLMALNYLPIIHSVNKITAYYLLFFFNVSEAFIYPCKVRASPLCALTVWICLFIGAKQWLV